MANFDSDNKLIWAEITSHEAQSFINFLRLEIFRHEREMEVCVLLQKAMDSFSVQLWGSAYMRHYIDILETNELISKVKEYHRL